MGILTKIRQGSDNQKKLIALISAIILTFIIVFSWFTLSKKPIADELAVEEQNKLSSVSPVQMIKDEFSKVFSNFNDKIAEPESSTTVEVEIINEEVKVDEEITN